MGAIKQLLIFVTIIFLFSITSVYAYPFKPELKSPDINALIDTTTPTLQWHADEWGLYIYKLKIFNNKDEIIYSKDINGEWNNDPQYTIPSGKLERGKSYWWQVQSVKRSWSGDVYSDYSSRDFRIRGDCNLDYICYSSNKCVNNVLYSCTYNYDYWGCRVVNSQSCPYGCSNNKCNSKPACYSDSDCGSESFKEKTCDGSILTNIFNKPRCVNSGTSNAYCTNDLLKRTVENCDNRNQFSTRHYCNGNQVIKETSENKFSCTTSGCRGVLTNNAEIVKTCSSNEICDGGECKPKPCQSDNDCGSGKYCSSGNCYNDVCQQGTIYCKNNNLVRCDDRGTSENNIEPCLYGCQNNQCIKPQCGNNNCETDKGENENNCPTDCKKQEDKIVIFYNAADKESADKLYAELNKYKKTELIEVNTDTDPEIFFDYIDVVVLGGPFSNSFARFLQPVFIEAEDGVGLVLDDKLIINEDNAWILNIIKKRDGSILYLAGITGEDTKKSVNKFLSSQEFIEDFRNNRENSFINIDPKPNILVLKDESSKSIIVNNKGADVHNNDLVIIKALIDGKETNLRKFMEEGFFGILNVPLSREEINPGSSKLYFFDKFAPPGAPLGEDYLVYLVYKGELKNDDEDFLQAAFPNKVVFKDINAEFIRNCDFIPLEQSKCKEIPSQGTIIINCPNPFFSTEILCSNNQKYSTNKFEEHDVIKMILARSPSSIFKGASKFIDRLISGISKAKFFGKSDVLNYLKGLGLSEKEVINVVNKLPKKLRLEYVISKQSGKPLSESVVNSLKQHVDEVLTYEELKSQYAPGVAKVIKRSPEIGDFQIVISKGLSAWKDGKIIKTLETKFGGPRNYFYNGELTQSGKQLYNTLKYKLALPKEKVESLLHTVRARGHQGQEDAIKSIWNKLKNPKNKKFADELKNRGFDINNEQDYSRFRKLFEFEDFTTDQIIKRDDLLRKATEFGNINKISLKSSAAVNDLELNTMYISEVVNNDIKLIVPITNNFNQPINDIDILFKINDQDYVNKRITSIPSYYTEEISINIPRDKITGLNSIKIELDQNNLVLEENEDNNKDEYYLFLSGELVKLNNCGNSQCESGEDSTNCSKDCKPSTDTTPKIICNKDDDCPAAKYCENNECKSVVCVPGGVYCKESDKLARCDDRGISESITQCQYGCQIGQNSKCLEAQCGNNNCETNLGENENNCAADCKKPEVVSISCNKDEDCGGETSTFVGCDNDKAKKEFNKFVCLNSGTKDAKCSSNKFTATVDCPQNQICIDKDCKQLICNKDNDCGNEKKEDKLFCKDNNLFDNLIKLRCTEKGTKCREIKKLFLVESCSNGCDKSSCVDSRCSDSDSNDIYIKGTTNNNQDYCLKYETNNKNKVSECFGSNCFIVEYKCQDNKAVSSSFVCNNGCRDGACLPELNKPTIITNPTARSNTINVNDVLQFSANVQGSETYYYEWYVDNNLVSKASSLSYNPKITESGDHNILLIIKGTTTVFNEEWNVKVINNVASDKPDLELKEFILINPTQLKANNDAIFKLVVRNNGLVDVSQARYSLHYKYQSFNINAGEEKIIFDKLVFISSNILDIKLALDPDNLIDEINELNNEKTISVSVS